MVFIKSVLLIFLVSAVISSEALKITNSDVTFTSQYVKTNVVIKKDSTLSVDGGIQVTASLIGSGAPQVQTEELLRVKEGAIEVIAQPKQEGITSGSKTTDSKTTDTKTTEFSMSAAYNKLPSMYLLVGLVVTLSFRRLNAITIAFGLAMLIGAAIALDNIDPAWTVQVVISVPSSYKLNSLSVSISQGTLKSDPDVGVTIGKLNIDLCGRSGNQVSLDGFAISQSGSVCATHEAKMNSVILTGSSDLKVTSKEDSGYVFVKNPYLGSFEVNAKNGIALSDSCVNPQLTNSSTTSLVGNCDAQKYKVAISGYYDAILSSAEDTTLSGAKKWSDAATWGGKVPAAGSDVVIAEGETVVLDGNTESLKSLVIRGKLIADPSKDFTLTSGSIDVYGTLRVGFLSRPYSANGRFVLTGLKGNYTSRAPLLAFVNDGKSRGVRAQNGSKFFVFGTPPRTTYTRLNEHAAKGDTVLTVDSVLGWKAGDELVISPTTTVTTSQSDYRTIVSVDYKNNKVTIDKGLSFARWGKIQYMTDAGVSLTPGVFDKMRAHPDVPDILDERAVIVHLTRNVVIEGANDTEWQNGHGVHVMWMGRSEVHLNGLEVRRAGQAGAIGRYALHAHMQSYNMPNGNTWPAESDGKFTGDVNTFVRNCAVHESVNRAIVIHGTCGARYTHNVASDILGHAMFFEDGSEIRNHFIANVVLNVRRPKTENQILRTEAAGDGSSGIWFSNGNNHFRDNIVGDVREGLGIWNSLANRPNPTIERIVKPDSITFSADAYRYVTVVRESWTITAINESGWSVVGSLNGRKPDAISTVRYQDTGISFTISGSSKVGDVITFNVEGYGGGCFGQSRYVELYPMFTPILDYDNNTAFACLQKGMMTDGFIVDEYGNLGSDKFPTFNDSLPHGDIYNDYHRIPTHFKGHRIWMNNHAAYSSRVMDPLYTGWLVADNGGTDLNGQTIWGKIANFLFVGNSLNNLDPLFSNVERHALATYHFSLDFHNMTFFNYPPIPQAIAERQKWGSAPGIVQSWELYLSSVEMGSHKLSNWRQFNVTPFERQLPPNMEMEMPEQFDVANNPHFWIRFYTFSGALYDHQGIFAGTDGEYIIFDHPFLNYNLSSSRRIGRDVSLSLATPHKFYGLFLAGCDGDASFDAQTWIRLDKDFNQVGKWVIQDGKNSVMLGHMRHASAAKYGIYQFYNHNRTTPYSQKIEWMFQNADSNGDEFILGFPWDANVTPKLTAFWGGVQLVETRSRSDMAATPGSYFRELSTNQIWYHHKNSTANLGYDRSSPLSVYPA